jgi:predicted dehydrogenase
MKILIVGCGSIGQRHARNFGKFADVIVCDTDQEKAETLAKELSCTVFTDFSKALAGKPEGVVIALPTHLHYDAVKQALARGARVLVEKPICINLAQAAELVKLGGERLLVVSNMRFHEAVLAVQEGLTSIGKPLFARAHFGNHLPSMRPGVDYSKLYVAKRETGGGALMDCIHEIDYLAHIFGPIEQVSADLARLGDLKIETEDYASLQLRHASGFCSELHLDYLQQIKQRGCEVIGTEGTVIWRSIGKAPEHCKVEVFTKASGSWTTLLDTLALDINACYVALAEDFCSVLKGQKASSISSAVEGYAALACVQAAYQSAAEDSQCISIKKI